MWSRWPRRRKRIVSLAPHVTEMLFAAGAASAWWARRLQRLPRGGARIARVGGYTRIDLEAVAALRPDLVIGWQSGNATATSPPAGARHPALPERAAQPEDVARNLERLGTLAGSEPAAAGRDAACARAATTSPRRTRPARPVRVFYQIWEAPADDGERPPPDRRRDPPVRRRQRVRRGRPPDADDRRRGGARGQPGGDRCLGMGEARPEWLDQWSRWPQLEAARRDNLFFIPPS
jgi:iron complex transport system substrate-binding protein